jgi:mannose-6-phosphate isomerase-like protein (cupin superfamily)
MNTSELTIPIEDTEVKILMQAGFFHFSNIQTPLHDHIYAEIHLIEQGSFNFYIDGICHRFEAGDVMAIPAGLYHYYTDASHDLRHLAFQVSLPLTEYRHIHLPTRLMADMMNAIDQYRRSGRRIKLIGYLSMLCSQFMEDKPGVVPHIEDRELLIYEFFPKNIIRMYRCPTWRVCSISPRSRPNAWWRNSPVAPSAPRSPIIAWRLPHS